MKKLLLLGLILAPVSFTGGCKPRTPAQKIEDKAEDVQHEIKQGAERTKENINDAVKK